jgi:hypothetical protein
VAEEFTAVNTIRTLETGPHNLRNLAVQEVKHDTNTGDAQKLHNCSILVVPLSSLYWVSSASYRLQEISIMEDFAAGRTVPVTDDRSRLQRKAIDLCALVCIHVGDLDLGAIMSLFRALSLPRVDREAIPGMGNESDEGIIDLFGTRAMVGRRDGAEKVFPIKITQGEKPKSRTTRLLLRWDSQGQWKYLVNKTKETLRRLTFVDYRGPLSFAEKVRLGMECVLWNASGVALVRPSVVVVTHVTIEEFVRVFQPVAFALFARGLPLVLVKKIFFYCRPNVVPNVVHGAEAGDVSILRSAEGTSADTVVSRGEGAPVADGEVSAVATLVGHADEVSTLSSGQRAAAADAESLVGHADEVSTLSSGQRAAAADAESLVGHADEVSTLSSLGSGASPQQPMKNE